MTVSAVIDENGITIPSYDEILADLVSQFKVIFGLDAYLEPDAQDLQMLAIFATATHDANQMAVDVYNAFSPTTAQGAGLSSMVKINGIRRKIASYSSVTVTLTGQDGTTLDNPVVADTQGNTWLLPATVVIPVNGEIDVTAVARDAGAITAEPDTVTAIVTPHPGWQEVTNKTAAVPGKPIESDAELRRRQTQSTAISAQSPVAPTWAGILNLPGVVRAMIYENDSDLPDDAGIPAHSIAAVVEGGDVDDIAHVIAYTKSPGTGTYGTTSVRVLDPHGIPNTVNFFIMEAIPIFWRITIQPLVGYLAATGDLIKETMALYFNEMNIGEKVYHNRLFAPANLSGGAAVRATGQTQEDLDKLSATYNVTVIELSLDGDTFIQTDVVIPFTAAAISKTDDGTLVLTGAKTVAVDATVRAVPDFRRLRRVR
jgi:uncharacterized phage protein gp47/JayE